MRASVRQKTSSNKARRVLSWVFGRFHVPARSAAFAPSFVALLDAPLTRRTLVLPLEIAAAGHVRAREQERSLEHVASGAAELVRAFVALAQTLVHADLADAILDLVAVVA